MAIVVFDVSGTVARDHFSKTALEVLARSGKLHVPKILFYAKKIKKRAGTGAAVQYIYDQFRRLNILRRFLRRYNLRVSRDAVEGGYWKLMEDLRRNGHIVVVATTGPVPKNLRDVAHYFVSLEPSTEQPFKTKEEKHERVAELLRSRGHDPKDAILVEDTPVEHPYRIQIVHSYDEGAEALRKKLREHGIHI